MDALVLPFSAPLTAYQRAIQIFHNNHPRFLDDEAIWLPKRIPDSAIHDTALMIEDAQLAVARVYDFQNGDASALAALIEANPKIVPVRSIRRTHFDPPIRRATLLHYVAANGVEGFRRKTPENAVEIATILLKNGAEPNSLASLCGGECTTMTLLVSSCHPAEAADADTRHRALALAAQQGHTEIVDLLLDAGADPNRQSCSFHAAASGRAGGPRSRRAAGPTTVGKRPWRSICAATESCAALRENIPPACPPPLY